MTCKLQPIVLAIAMVATFPMANAAERVDADRLAACAKESDETRRLACYDDAIAATKEVAAEKAPSEPAAPVTTPKAATSERAAPSVSATSPASGAAPVSAEKDFGVAGSAVARQRQQEQEQQQDETSKASSITAQVSAVSSRPHGELVITLDNGQVWAQKRKERYFAAKPGDTATINAGMLGSYRMIIGNRSTHVTRIK